MHGVQGQESEWCEVNSMQGQSPGVKTEHLRTESRSVVFRWSKEEEEIIKMRKYEAEEIVRNGLLRANQKMCFKEYDQYCQGC